MARLHLFNLALPVLLTVGCAKPEGDVGEPNSDGPPLDGDEVGELPGDPEDPPMPLPSGYCLGKAEPPHEGIRHHCGGSLSMSITGDALGQPVNEDVYLEFGPQVPGDTYEQPRVAACCGEYDFEQPASNQPEYWRNCLYDGVQQLCAALPYYIWDMAASAKKEGDLVVADQLTKLGNDLATGSEQYDCMDNLYLQGPEESFSSLTDRSWNIAWDVWLELHVLEADDIWLPEDPGDYLTCKSIYENDETVVPDIGPGPIWDEYGLESGSVKLSGLGLEMTESPDTTSELLVAHGMNGEAVLGALQLHGGELRVEGLTFERWRLATLRSVAARAHSDGSFQIPTGSITFVGSVVFDGEAISVSARNASPLVLRESVRGWMIDPFSLVYTMETGDVWTLESSELLFRLR